MRRIWLWAFFLLMGAFPVQSADISLKISAEENWKAWGDYILGQDLKQGFEELNYSVEPSYISNFYPKGSEDCLIDVYMHGFVPFNIPLKKGKTNVLYLYYPLEVAQSYKYKNLKE